MMMMREIHVPIYQHFIFKEAKALNVGDDDEEEDGDQYDHDDDEVAADDEEYPIPAFHLQRGRSLVLAFEKFYFGKPSSRILSKTFSFVSSQFF